jgi:hypothetical protein
MQQWFYQRLAGFEYNTYTVADAHLWSAVMHKCNIGLSAKVDP